MPPARFPPFARAVVASAALLLGGSQPPAHANAPFPPLAGNPVVRTAIAADPAGAPATEHVVVISIDGLRPDAIGRFGARTIQRVMREGSYTLRATTVMQSRTLPSHTSMLTGEEPARHGITWNSDQTDTHGVVSVPTIFALARSYGLETAAFFSKPKLQHLQVPNTLDHSEAPERGEKWSADLIVSRVEDYLDGDQPNLLSVHLGEPDYAGHRYSWMSWFYGRAVRKADLAVADILAASDEAFGDGEYAVILTADHGGHGWSHGSNDPRDMTIPWIAWGEGIRQGVVVDDDVHTVDTAATALSARTDAARRGRGGRRCAGPRAAGRERGHEHRCG